MIFDLNWLVIIEFRFKTRAFELSLILMSLSKTARAKMKTNQIFISWTERAEFRLQNIMMRWDKNGLLSKWLTRKWDDRSSAIQMVEGRGKTSLSISQKQNREKIVL